MRPRNNNFVIHLILLCISCVLIINDYLDSKKVNHVDVKCSLLDPYNATQLSTTDKYDQLIDLNKFSFKVNPQICKDYSAGLFLIIIVSSNPNLAKNRAIIRNTWGKAVDSTKIVFLLGEVENATLSYQIKQESKIYGDIVQGNFIDSYRNMTYKNVMGMKWVAHHCPSAKYVLKTDDDVVVNSKELRRFLTREMSPWGARDLIACQVKEPEKVVRSGSYKWKVTYEEYKLDYFPQYCLGWAIVYSTDMVIKLLEKVPEVPYFWIDDIYITGLLAGKINASYTPLNNLILSYGNLVVVKSGWSAYVGTFLFGPANMRSNDMESLWRAIPA